MPNKKKTGKARKDKFYQLAKESGFRARSAFKLIQLNRKFEFLQNSRVVIDLCAAPGGWLQVVAENSPVSSLIVGVDLVAIKPIRNVKTLVDDITTDKCRSDLKKELLTWKADCVLHDGAPNVGKNWVHDAFMQNNLTLQALKLAVDFLKKGGWFVTKVFRSKDYNALLWVFQQLFRNVYATKPQASRNESAEIFVVCQNYLAPDKMDPKFLDPKAVFKDVDKEPKKALDLIHPEKQRRHREGYPEGDYTLFHTLKVSEFMKSDNYLQLFAEASEIVFDDKEIENHTTTTLEIKECLKDIKVLGKKDIRKIINWRKKLVSELYEDKKSENEAKEVAIEEKEENSDDEIAKLEEELKELQGEQRKEMKRKIRKTRKEKSKLQHKVDMKIVLPNDNLELSDNRELFDLNQIKSKKQLTVVEEVELSDIEEGDSSEESEEDVPVPGKKKRIGYGRDTKDYLDPHDEPEDEMEDSDDESEAESDISLPEAADDDDANPLLVGRMGKKAKMDMWFSKDSFADLENDEDEDIEIGNMVKVYKKKGGVIRGEEEQKEVVEEEMIIPEEKITESKEKEKKRKKKNDTPVIKKAKLDDKDSAIENDSSETDSSDSDSDFDSDSDYDTKEFYKQQKQSNKEKKAVKTDSFEVVKAEDVSNVKLSAKGLAIGAAIVSSRKRRREIIESGYHRYMFNDENLPDWFVKEERKHHVSQIPITKGDIEEYKMKMKSVDANPIRKIAEAKARKKRKQVKKLDRARKKADNINETEDVTDREKWQQIKQVYKRAGLLSAKKKQVTYVVSKKGTAGKRVRRPNGVSGPYRVVDGRMKKDNKAEKMAAKKNKGKGKKRK